MELNVADVEQAVLKNRKKYSCLGDEGWKNITDVVEFNITAPTEI